MAGVRNVRRDELVELLLAGQRRDVPEENDGDQIVLILFDQAQHMVGILPEFSLILLDELGLAGLLLLLGERQERLDEVIVFGDGHVVLLVALGELDIERGAGHGRVRDADAHGLAVVEEREIPFPTIDLDRQQSVFRGRALQRESAVGDDCAVDGFLGDPVHQVDRSAVLRRVRTRDVILCIVSRAGQQASCGERQGEN